METLKPKRLREHGDVVGGGDRLSSLPDELLTRIISLLPTTKDGIRTSILAKRWNYLWTCLPSYNFVLLGPGVPDIKFVDRLLLSDDLHDRRFSMEKFSVVASADKTVCYPLDLDAWISSLIKRNIKQINLRLPHPSFFLGVHSSLFTCKTLTSLQLYGAFCLDLSTSSIRLPSLKVLKLSLIKYSNNETISRLLSGCPILEELTVERHSADGVECLNIAVPSLKCLVVKFCVAHGNFATTIDARNLVTLKINDHASKYIHVHNTSSSLVRAFIDISRLPLSSLEVGSIVPLLLAITNVKILTLGTNIIDYLNLYNLDLPKFHNVRKLTLRVNLAKSVKVLTNILESMPKLQKLVIGVDHSHKYVSDWIPPEDVPVCLSSHLKTVKICDIFRWEDEVKLVKYFRENGKVLKKMIIISAPFKDSSSGVESRMVTVSTRIVDNLVL